MDRYWLLTSTFCGNWLPGDPRGFVSRVRDVRPGEETTIRHEHDDRGTPYDADLEGLYQAAKQSLRGESIWLNTEQAEVLLQQFHETAAYRGWQLRAVAIMSNHVHLVVGVDGDPDPTRILGDFKAYGSRALNARWGKPSSGRWWTYAGSKRKLPDERAVQAAVSYVSAQAKPLVIWVAGERGGVSAPSESSGERGGVSAPSESSGERGGVSAPSDTSGERGGVSAPSDTHLETDPRSGR